VKSEPQKIISTHFITDKISDETKGMPNNALQNREGNDFKHKRLVKFKQDPVLILHFTYKLFANR